MCPGFFTHVCEKGKKMIAEHRINTAMFGINQDAAKDILELTGEKPTNAFLVFLGYLLKKKVTLYRLDKLF